ncbi:hypothetical protein ACJX0J_009111, partial [Zea mays]
MNKQIHREVETKCYAIQSREHVLESRYMLENKELHFIVKIVLLVALEVPYCLKIIKLFVRNDFHDATMFLTTPGGMLQTPQQLELKTGTWKIDDSDLSSTDHTTNVAWLPIDDSENVLLAVRLKPNCHMRKKVIYIVVRRWY